MKKLAILMFGILLMAMMINIAEARLSFFQQKYYMGNGTVKDHIFGLYNKNDYLGEDFVSTSKPLEAYLFYSIYPKKSNNQTALQYQVSRCDLNVYITGRNVNATIVWNQTFNDLTDDVNNGKYFVQLANGEGIFADIICYYKNTSDNDFHIPAVMQLVTPTTECKECQFYEWSLIERDIVKARSIGDNVVTVADYIKRLFMLNFEIWLSFFWIFLILMVLMTLGFIFMGIYWLFKYLNNMAK